MAGMDQMRVTATDFRVHFKDLGNQVARGGASVAVERHGLVLGVFVNEDDFAELLEFKRMKREANGEPAQDEVLTAPREHPESMPFEEVQRVYQSTAGSTDEWTLNWRRWAAQLMQAKAPRGPAGPPS